MQLNGYRCTNLRLLCHADNYNYRVVRLMIAAILIINCLPLFPMGNLKLSLKLFARVLQWLTLFIYEVARYGQVYNGKKIRFE